MFVANSLSDFQQRFSDGLEQMLASNALGAYILVLANSLQAQDLQAQLKVRLAKNFTELKQDFDKGTLSAAPDDIDVFQKLLQINPETLALTQAIQANDWLLLCNTMRGLRPARAARQVITDLRRDFDADKFNFNKAFLRPEILWQGACVHDDKTTDLRVLYNKFPLAPYHLLVVPDAEFGQPQFLTQHYHHMIAALAVQAQDNLSGLYFGYNSLGAYASVNHLHFHAVLRDTRLPVEALCWTHRGGDRDYPLKLKLYASADDSWHAIEQLHAAGQTYNLLYTHDGVYVLPRRAQNTVTVPALMQGAGWPELCGEVTVSEAPAANAAAGIERGLHLLSVS